jgi:hypothetical protein
LPLLRHCEARSAMAIHAVVRWPIDRFVPRDDEVIVRAAAALTLLLRHCEARSAVAIHAVVQWPMDRFVPRDDEVIARAAATR